MTERRINGPPLEFVCKAATWSTTWPAVFLTMVVLFPAQASADPVQIGLGLQEHYSDNMRRTSDNKQSDLQSRAFVTITQNSTDGQCRSNVNGEVGYSKYLNKTYVNQTDANLDLAGNCNLYDGLFWSLSDNLAQVPANNSLPDTPGNSVRKNVVKTGPNWILKLSPTDSVNLSTTLQDTKFWNTSANTVSLNTHNRNSREVSGSAGYTHLFDPSLSAGMDASLSRTYFNGDEKLTKRSGDLRLAKHFAKTKFSGSFGYSKLDDQIGGQSNNSGGAVWNLRVTRQVNEHASWYLAVNREYTNTSSNYPVQIAGFNFNYAQSSAVKVTSYRGGYENRLDSGSQLSLTLGRDESDHLLTNRSDTTDLVNAQFDKPLSQTWRGLIGIGYQRQQFGYNDLTNNTANAYIGARYQRTKALSFNTRIGHNLRHSSSSSLEYAENFVDLGVRYDFR